MLRSRNKNNMLFFRKPSLITGINGSNRFYDASNISLHQLFYASSFYSVFLNDRIEFMTRVLATISFSAIISYGFINN